MADIKKMILDFDNIITRKKEHVERYDEKIKHFCQQIDGLNISIGLISDSTAINLLNNEIRSISAVRDNYFRFLTEAETSLNITVQSRKDFMEVIRMNCNHDWIFDFTDGHNGDDNYHCSICNAHRS